ncbi:Abi family protein [Actinotalea sp. JY-7885]|uniref:Abi family protein n=1 Tax=Actinotalea sp. JY-7885 TaxID=2758576 RepID=UPI00165E89D5|nr:Abi family protein [Actinotalea sp. JY-7885]
MSTPPWIDTWLTPGRFQKYRNAAGGDAALALALYEWNADLASAFLRDLGHLEIGLRNAYDRALAHHPGVAGDWLDNGNLSVLFPVHFANDKHGNPQDKNATPRGNIATARKHSGYDNGVVPRGKAVAELMFGFWSYLTDDLHEKTLWVKCLHTAYTPGADRAVIHGALSALRALRNRVAHHESIFDRSPESHRRHIIHVAKHLSPELHGHIAAASRLPDLIANRPR